MFVPTVPLHTASLLSSFTTTSFTLFSSVAGTSMGIIPLINQRYEPFPITSEQKVKAWNSYFSRAMIYAVGISLVSTGTSLLTAYIHPNPQVRTLSLLSGISSFMIGPMTFGLGLPPINSQLQEMGRENGVSVDEWKKRTNKVDELVLGWEQKHNVRYVSFVGAWALSAAALLSVLSK